MKFFVISLIFCNLSTTSAFAGQESHGGDPLALEFVAKAWGIIDHLAASGDLRGYVSVEDIAAFRAELSRTDVIVVDAKLHVGEQRVTVKHTPYERDGELRHRVEVDRRQLYDWLQRGGDLYRIVFHELLWMIGHDDTNYRISHKLRLPHTGLSAELADSICTEHP